MNYFYLGINSELLSKPDTFSSLVSLSTKSDLEQKLVKNKYNVELLT